MLYTPRSNFNGINYYPARSLRPDAISAVCLAFHIQRHSRLGLWTLKERRNRCDLIEVFKMFYGYTEIDIRVLFALDGNDKSLRGHSKKICKPRFNMDIRKYFFSNRVIDRWNSLDHGHC